jgi:glycosyltransferase involved in cell wall biosynthesis
VTILKKRTPHDEMLRYFSESRIYVGISLSDGISTSLLEAMATGCYPIQTGTSCAKEWLIQDSGSVVDLSPENSVQDALIEALISDERVDHAALSNFKSINDSAKFNSIKLISQRFYDSIN